VKAYERNGEQYFSVLSNAIVMKEEPLKAEDINKSLPILENFKENASQIKDLLQAYNHLPKAIQEKIQHVSFTPSNVNATLVTLTMNDGNFVLVPIEDMVNKMEFYNSVASQLTEPSVIDMEVGIFSYPLSMKDQKIEKVSTTDTSDGTDGTQSSEGTP
jgi:cell division protein FtsQ